MNDDDEKDGRVAAVICCGILSPHFDKQPERTLTNAGFDKLIWELHDSGRCVVPDISWIN